MENLYDNGYQIIGSVKMVRDYTKKYCEDSREKKEMLEELKEYNKEDIVCLDYDTPMGVRTLLWKKQDIVEKI